MSVRTTHNANRFGPWHANGFTLIELLVVVSIISMLVGVLLPVLGSVRDTAREAQSLSNMRQTMVAYTAYHTDSKGQLLYGYTPLQMNGSPVQVEYEGHTFGDFVAMRYPFRIAPYLNNAWDILYSHISPPEVPAASDSSLDAHTKAYALSLAPTFGINSVYVGGHGAVSGVGRFEGFDANGSANRGGHVVFRDAEVKRPSELIVFSDARDSDTLEDEPAGYFYVIPPRADGQWWHADGSRVEVVNGAYRNGLPIGYHSDKSVTGFFDGHAELMSPAELEDMRLWANQATSEDYDFK